MGSCGFQRRFYENLQHLRWAPVWALVGSNDVSMRIYSILCAPQVCSGGRAGAVYKRIFGLKC